MDLLRSMPTQITGQSPRIALTGGGALFGGLLGQTLAVSGNSDVHFDLPN
jgi:hypothetical protein